MRSCGNGLWCCGPDVARGTCNCEENKGTFKIRDGKAQTIIGVQAFQRTATDAIARPSAAALSSSPASKPEPTPSEAQATSSAAGLSSTATSTINGPYSRASSTGPPLTAISTSTPARRSDNHVTVIAPVVSIVGFVVVSIGGLLVYFCCFKRRTRAHSSQADDTATSPMIGSPDLANVAQPTEAPQPDPYHGRFPSQQELNSGSDVPARRSRMTVEIVPDHDPQTEGHQYQDLRHAPAYDPYAIPDLPANAFENQRRHWRSQQPTCRTDNYL
ncbi:MAG: hypothetical protein Q9196_000361 [Gyalolechia fulgens]